MDAKEIAEELGVSKGSVSVWVRDVEFVPKPRNRGHGTQRPHPFRVRKLAEIEQCRVEAETLIGALSSRDMTMFCLALYAGEGSKTEGAGSLANTDPVLMGLRRMASIQLREHPDDISTGVQPSRTAVPSHIDV